MYLLSSIEALPTANARGARYFRATLQDNRPARRAKDNVEAPARGARHSSTTHQGQAPRRGARYFDTKCNDKSSRTRSTIFPSQARRWHYGCKSGGHRCHRRERSTQKEERSTLEQSARNNSPARGAGSQLRYAKTKLMLEEQKVSYSNTMCKGVTSARGPRYFAAMFASRADLSTREKHQE
jgi:hypothetical protein